MQAAALGAFYPETTRNSCQPISLFLYTDVNVVLANMPVAYLGDFDVCTVAHYLARALVVGRRLGAELDSGGYGFIRREVVALGVSTDAVGPFLEREGAGYSPFILLDGMGQGERSEGGEAHDERDIDHCGDELY